MKAILEFNLPEEEPEYRTHIDGYKYSSILFELDQQLRSIVKYQSSAPILGNTPPTEEQIQLAEKIRSYLYDACAENNVSLV